MIAFLIDRHEQLAEDEEFETMCTDLYTPALEEAIASEAGRSCPAELADELADTFVVDTEVREIEIRGTNATATYEEAGDPGTFYLVEQDGRWLIDAIE